MTDKIVISADRGFRRRGSFRHGCASARQAAERQGDQAFLRRLVRAIRAHWPRTEILLRADSHYCGPEVLDWCRAGGLDYILGVAPTTTLRRHVAGLEASPKARFEAGSGDGKLRRFKEFFDGAQSWSRVERIVARVEVGEEGADTRFVVTNLTHRNARRIYEDVYCRRGQAENHIKSWKTHLAADRTSCTKATATASGSLAPVPMPGSRASRRRGSRSHSRAAPRPWRRRKKRRVTRRFDSQERYLGYSAAESVAGAFSKSAPVCCSTTRIESLTLPRSSWPSTLTLT